MRNIDIEVNGELMTVYYNLSDGIEGDDSIPNGTRKVYYIEDITCPMFEDYCLYQVRKHEELD